MISPAGHEFLYVPNTLFSYRLLNDFDPKHNFSPNVLIKFGEAVRSGRVSKYSLEKREWDLEVINIPDKRISDFTNACFRKRSKRRLNNRATGIFNYAFLNSFLAVESGLREKDDVEYVSDERVMVHEGGYEETLPEKDEEDIGEDWWSRGDKPPF